MRKEAWISTYLLLDILRDVLLDVEFRHSLLSYLHSLSLHLLALRSHKFRCRFRGREGMITISADLI